MPSALWGCSLPVCGVLLVYMPRLNVAYTLTIDYHKLTLAT